MKVTDSNVFEKDTRHILKMGDAFGITLPLAMVKTLDLKPKEEVSVIFALNKKQAIFLIKKIDVEGEIKELVSSARSELLEASE